MYTHPYDPSQHPSCMYLISTSNRSRTETQKASGIESPNRPNPHLSKSRSLEYRHSVSSLPPLLTSPSSPLPLIHSPNPATRPTPLRSLPQPPFDSLAHPSRPPPSPRFAPFAHTSTHSNSTGPFPSRPGSSTGHASQPFSSLPECGRAAVAAYAGSMCMACGLTGPICG